MFINVVCQIDKNKIIRKMKIIAMHFLASCARPMRKEGDELFTDHKNYNMKHCNIIAYTCMVKKCIQIGTTARQ